MTPAFIFVRPCPCEGCKKARIETKGGHRGGKKPVSQYRRPPKGPAPGVRK